MLINSGEANRLAEDGLVRVLRGDQDGALPLLERAVRLGAGDLVILTELARIYRAKGRSADAVRLLEPLVTPSSDQMARRELARARLEARDFAGALAESTAMIEALDLSAVHADEMPEIVDIYETCAEAARRSGDSIRSSVLYSALKDILERAHRRDLVEKVSQTQQRHAEAMAEQLERQARDEEARPDPRFGDLLRQSRRYVRDGHVFAALDTSYDAMALDSASLQPFLEIAEGYVIAAQPAAARTLLHSVQDVARLRESTAELAAIRRLLGRISGDLALREQAIQRFLDQGETADAVAELVDLGGEARECGDRGQAIGLYERAVRLDTDHPTATFALAALLMDDGREAEAMTTIQRAADRRLAAQGMEGALRFWAEAIASVPTASSLRRAFGEQLRRWGKPAEGARELTAAADLAARDGTVDADSLLAAAQVYDELDDLAAALRIYDRLMRAAPSNAVVQEHFVAFCLRRNRPDLAGRALRSLAEFLLARDGEHGPSEAVAALTQLMVLLADDPWAYERLAAILMEEGRSAEAAMVYRQLAARRPNDPAVRHRLRQLGERIEAMTQAPVTRN